MTLHYQPSSHRPKIRWGTRRTPCSRAVSRQVDHIFDCGPAGLRAFKVSKSAGAEKVIAVDLSDYRLDLATKMGCDLTSKEDVKKRVQEAVPHGADVILEMSGSEKALNDDPALGCLFSGYLRTKSRSTLRRHHLQGS